MMKSIVTLLIYQKCSNMLWTWWFHLEKCTKILQNVLVVHKSSVCLLVRKLFFWKVSFDRFLWRGAHSKFQKEIHGAQDTIQGRIQPRHLPAQKSWDCRLRIHPTPGTQNFTILFDSCSVIYQKKNIPSVWNE